MSKPEAAPARSLVRKLSEVMGEVERIAKNGRNEFHKYDYATEADITSAVRQHMADRRLMLMPNVEKTEWETIQVAGKAPKKVCTLTVKFTLMDGDSGEEQSFIMLGQGEDSGDKATYKAMTGATKYALLKLFLIPTGDDPENDSEHRFTPSRRPPAPTPEQSSAPAAAPTKARSAPAGEILVPFGKSKGKKLSEVSDADLTWLLAAFKKSVDANDPKFHSKNVAQLEAAQAEAARRINAPASPTSNNEPDVWAMVSDLMKQHGASGQAAASRIKGVTGKTDRSKLTMEDYEKIKASMAAVPPMPGQEEVPF